MRERQKVVALANLKEPSLLQFYISREWLNKFNTFTEPGPISNHTFLCQHGGQETHTYIQTARHTHTHTHTLSLFSLAAYVPGSTLLIKNRK